MKTKLDHKLPFKAIKGYWEKDVYSFHSKPSIRDGYHWMGAIGSEEWNNFFKNKQHAKFVEDWMNHCFDLGREYGPRKRKRIKTVFVIINNKKRLMNLYKEKGFGGTDYIYEHIAGEGPKK